MSDGSSTGERVQWAHSPVRGVGPRAGRGSTIGPVRAEGPKIFSVGGHDDAPNDGGSALTARPLALVF